MSVKHIVSKLAESVGEYKKTALLTLLFIFIEAFMEVQISTMMADLIDNGISVGNLEHVWFTGGILIIFAFISLVAGIVAGKCSAVSSAGFAKNLRRTLFHATQKFSFTSIDKFSPSSLITRLTTDVTRIQNSFYMLIRSTSRALFLLILPITVVVIINPQLSLVYLAAIPILGIGMYMILTKAHPIFERVAGLYDKLNCTVRENLQGIRVVKTFVRAECATEKFKDVSSELYREYSSVEKLMIFTNPLIQFCVYLCILLISWFGGQLVVSEVITRGELVSMISYSLQILTGLMMLSMNIVTIVMARASACRIVDVLDEETNCITQENPWKDVGDGSVVFENVNFRYKNGAEQNVLENVNLSIESGEMVGILGSTGSAKTTLVQLISRLYDVESGSVKVGGVDVREYDLQVLRDAVSIILQKNTLFSGTVRENLLFGNTDAGEADLNHACRIAHADEFIQNFPEGYDAVIEHGGNNLSGGQKQRLCIARALLKKPKILILDDSTSAVDTKTEAAIHMALKSELPETTKLIITQRISTIEGVDKIIVMNGGKIEAVGTHEDLLVHNKIYREFYLSQSIPGGI